MRKAEAETAQLRQQNAECTQPPHSPTHPSTATYQPAPTSSHTTHWVCLYSLRLSVSCPLSDKRRLKSVKDENAFLRDQMSDNSRSQSRSQVNLDYLKSILVRFLSFDPTHPQRKALIPVIATILQFSPDELRNVEKVKSSSGGWLSMLGVGSAGGGGVSADGSVGAGHSMPLHIPAGVDADSLPLSFSPHARQLSSASSTSTSSRASVIGTPPMTPVSASSSVGGGMNGRAVSASPASAPPKS